MANLIDITDVRLIAVYNGREDLLLFNQGYKRDAVAFVFQSYTIDVKNRLLTLVDTFHDSDESDLKLLVGMKNPLIGVFNLCKNGAARDGFLIHGAKFQAQDLVSSRPGCRDFKLECRGGYRTLSKSELFRGSRISDTEA